MLVGNKRFFVHTTESILVTVKRQRLCVALGGRIIIFSCSASGLFRVAIRPSLTSIQQRPFSSNTVFQGVLVQRSSERVVESLDSQRQYRQNNHDLIGTKQCRVHFTSPLLLDIFLIQNRLFPAAVSSGIGFFPTCIFNR